MYNVLSLTYNHLHMTSDYYIHLNIGNFWRLRRKAAFDQCY